ncbi:MAG TPA: O-methyltransferase [Gaiellales bacterium]|jgi:predicted O-methyltransferase YrrM|nr:O-methyltransferase [Gaiellales bacterium]
MDPLEQYLSERYWAEDDLLREVRSDIEQRGPAIQVSAEAGRLLALLVRAAGATRLLEVGTLFGYSGIWMARELAPGGHMDTIEIERLHADAAAHWFERAGLADRVTVHRGAGLDVLATLPGPYDVAFIDADKRTYPDYIRLSLERLRPGGIVIADNAIRGGRIAQAGGDLDMQGTRAMHDMLAADANLVATTVPVGDGLAIAVKRS